MNKIVTSVSVIVVGVVAWRMGDLLDRETIAMALGMLFGVLAGIPVSLLVLVANRQRIGEDERAKLRTEVEAELRADMKQYPLAALPMAWRVIDEKEVTYVR